MPTLEHEFYCRHNASIHYRWHLFAYLIIQLKESYKLLILNRHWILMLDAQSHFQHCLRLLGALGSHLIFKIQRFGPGGHFSCIWLFTQFMALVFLPLIWFIINFSFYWPYPLPLVISGCMRISTTPNWHKITTNINTHEF